MVAIFARTDAVDAAKDFTEVALVAKADGFGDFRDGERALRHEGLGFTDAEVVQIRDEGTAGGTAEEAHEVRFAHVEQLRGAFHGDAFHVVVGEIVQEGLEAMEVLRGQGRRGGGGGQQERPEQEQNHLEEGFGGEVRVGARMRAELAEAFDPGEDFAEFGLGGGEVVRGPGAGAEEGAEVFDAVGPRDAGEEGFAGELEERAGGGGAREEGVGGMILAAQEQQGAGWEGEIWGVAAGGRGLEEQLAAGEVEDEVLAGGPEGAEVLRRGGIRGDRKVRMGTKERCESKRSAGGWLLLRLSLLHIPNRLHLPNGILI